MFEIVPCQLYRYENIPFKRSQHSVEKRFVDVHRLYERVPDEAQPYIEWSECGLQRCNATEILSKSLEDDVKELQTNVADIMNAIASITNIPNIVSTSATTASNESFALLNGTNVNKLGAVSNDDYHQQRQKAIDDGEFAMLLTNVDVSVSETDIQQMASQAIGTPEPECINVTKLVSKWKSRNLDFVSFKIVFDSKFKTRALNPMIWPRSIKFREFVHRNTQTWKPNVIE